MKLLRIVPFALAVSFTATAFADDKAPTSKSAPAKDAKDSKGAPKTAPKDAPKDSKTPPKDAPAK